MSSQTSFPSMAAMIAVVDPQLIPGVRLPKATTNRNKRARGARRRGRTNTNESLGSSLTTGSGASGDSGYSSAPIEANKDEKSDIAASSPVPSSPAMIKAGVNSIPWRTMENPVPLAAQPEPVDSPEPKSSSKSVLPGTTSTLTTVVVGLEITSPANEVASPGLAIILHPDNEFRYSPPPAAASHPAAITTTTTESLPDPYMEYVALCNSRGVRPVSLPEFLVNGSMVQNTIDQSTADLRVAVDSNSHLAMTASENSISAVNMLIHIENALNETTTFVRQFHHAQEQFKEVVEGTFGDLEMAMVAGGNRILQTLDQAKVDVSTYQQNSFVLQSTHDEDQLAGAHQLQSEVNRVEGSLRRDLEALQEGVEEGLRGIQEGMQKEIAQIQQAHSLALEKAAGETKDLQARLERMEERMEKARAGGSLARGVGAGALVGGLVAAGAVSGFFSWEGLALLALSVFVLV